MLERFLLIATVIAASLSAGPLVETAQACPMCKEANETESALPKAYMYSILFMLGMPATIVAGFGIGFYRLSKQQFAEADDPTEVAPEND